MHFSTMRRSIIALLFVLVAAGAISASAQVVPAGFAKGLSLRAGGEASVFQPDYTGFGLPAHAPYANYLFGVGAFVDLKITPWVQFEGEGRWLRFNKIAGIYEDNYLVGPRLPIYRLKFKRATPYAKILIGYGKLNFEDGNGWGRYTALSYGGGLDIKMSKRLNFRLPDFEYQQWPKFSEGVGNTTTLFPYGVSVGVSYRVFGLR
jgi:hypothetical protein